MRIYLRAGEKFYVNGAVIQVDRKVSFTFLNDVTFLLENHVLQPEQADTPLKQLYFIVQMALIDPANMEKSGHLFLESYRSLIEIINDTEIEDGLKLAQEQFANGRAFDALKSIRALFAIENKHNMATKAALLTEQELDGGVLK
ncbi:MAG: flagellar biosynthesis repressor FlbT [Hyphomicrobiales bacterium]|nr:flagellar biosynthesis repressor FlbT [Hyphomicrobiales bacterium]